GAPPPTRRPGFARRAARAARPTATILILLLLFSGIAYPMALTYIAQELTPLSANGHILTSANGTAVASELLGQNISNTSLFYLRPSIIDYQPFTGAGGEVPYGPSDPLLKAEVNATIARYGLANLTVPLNLVAPSASGLDPDISDAAAWVQIPRIAYHTGLSQSALNAFVNAHLTNPELGVFGPPPYVNVIELDLLLIHDLATHTPLSAG
ncbi:MAG: potassium-transporting ATPase subunit C, partial [Thermoplasmata archaeon]